jgi:hypothetical protein
MLAERKPIRIGNMIGRNPMDRQTSALCKSQRCGSQIQCNSRSNKRKKSVEVGIEPGHSTGWLLANLCRGQRHYGQVMKVRLTRPPAVLPEHPHASPSCDALCAGSGMGASRYICRAPQTLCLTFRYLPRLPERGAVRWEVQLDHMQFSRHDNGGAP